MFFCFDVMKKQQDGMEYIVATLKQSQLYQSTKNGSCKVGMLIPDLGKPVFGCCRQLNSTPAITCYHLFILFESLCALSVCALNENILLLLLLNRFTVLPAFIEI